LTDTPTTGVVREPSLTRDLGSLEATTLVVGGIIGISIFVVPADVARLVGAPGLMLVTWALSGFLATCGALCLAELSAAIPLKRAYRGTPIAFLFGWMMCFAYATGAIAVVGYMAAIYAGQFLGRVMPYGTVAIRIVAVLIILVLTAINYLGVRQAGKTQNVLTFIKVGLIVAVVLLALLLGSGSLERFAPALPTASSSIG
jgi:APA family basic amino acid/polyamine antiporter